MVESSKFTEKATELAGQAAQAAGPAIEKAKEVAVDLAEKAAPLVEKAAVIAAQGVSAAAEQIDKATGGKYADKISAVSSKLEGALDRDKP
jgi:DNA-binding IclR family transcriptional regulator